MNPSVAVNRIVGLFETMAPQDVRRLGEIYRHDAYFKDPFNEVRGLAAVQKVFQHMFDALEAPRFIVTARVVQGNDCFLVWDFRYFFKGRRGGEQVVRGTSHLQLAEDGRIVSHRDYWDAAEEVYEKLPVLGSLMRWLKSRAKA